MRKLNTKKLIIVITLVAVLALFTTTVQATNGLVNPLLNLQGVSGNTTTNTTTNTSTTTTTTTNTETTQKKDELPKAGLATDTMMIIIVVGLVAMAIYTFKKVNEYNNI